MPNHESSAAYAALTALGATKVVAHFSGGNDEGGYDDIVFFNGDEPLTTLGRFAPYDEIGGQRWDNVSRTYVDKPAKNADRKAIALCLNSVLDASYGGFAGDFYVESRPAGRVGHFGTSF